MMDFIKKQRAAFYMYAAAAILGLIAFILYCANASTTYYNDLKSNIVILCVLGLIFLVASAVLPQFGFAQNKFVKIAIDVLRMFAAALFIWAMIVFIGDRVESYGYVYASDFEANNPIAVAAAGQSIVAIVFFVLTWFVAVVAAFFPIIKEEGTRVELARAAR